MNNNTKRFIELEILTPISIGAGNDYDWIYGIDYIVEGKKIYVIDVGKVVKAGIDIDQFNRLLQNLESERLEQLLTPYVKSIVKSPAFIFMSPLNKYRNPIKTFIRTNGRPYIPGSSLKGALRSVITKFLIGNLDKVDYKNGRFTTLLHDEKTGTPKKVDVYGEVKEGEDFLRFVQVGDIGMASTKILNTKIFNLQGFKGHWEGGWKHSNNMTTSSYDPNGFNTFYECIIPHEKGKGSICFADSAYERMKSKIKVNFERKQKLMSAGAEENLHSLFHVVNQYTLNYLRKELHFFQSYPVQRFKEIEQCITLLINEIESSQDLYCVLKMAAGSGYHSITGDWKYSDYTEDEAHTVKKNGNFISIPYKSRKVVEYNGQLQLMGFVKLTAI